MAVDAETRKEIRRQARLYAAEKDKVTTRIQENVDMAIKKLKAAERELLEEVEIEFDENPFEELLTKIDSENPPTEAEVRSTLAKGVPKDFGPSEESFLSLCREIEAFKSWREKAVPVPSNVRTASSGLWEVDIAWECDLSRISREIKGGSSSDVRYVVEIKKKNEDEGAWKEVYSGKDTKFTAKNLAVDTDTEYSVRVKCVVNGLESAWSGAATMKTRKVSVRNVRVTGTTRDAITVTWDAVEGASSYQIEVDGSESLESTTKSTFTKTGLLLDTEHSLRVRAVRGSAVSGWSDVVKGRTQKEPDFSECAWKECPGNVGANRKYSVDKGNPRIATFIGNDLCTIIGNTPLPHNTVTSWSIKVLKSKDNNGGCIYIGVAPFDIDQNKNYNRRNICGWYIYCYNSTLCSGPPHCYKWKEYGPRKGIGQYVHTGDSVGVVMDTAKGELSFVVGGANLGVAYERIPLDKPLVPCVILLYKGDSVELVI